MDTEKNNKFYYPTITLGNWITIGTLGVAMVVAYAQLATRKEVKDEISEVKKDYVSREVQKLEILLLRNQVEAIVGKLDDLRADIKDIKLAMKR